MKITKARFQLTAVLAVALSALLSLANAAEKTRLSVGYMPIMVDSQLFVIEGEGWLDEANIELDKKRFSSGPAMVQALASGQLDVVYFGIGPAMVARAKGVDLRVVAGNVQEQIAFIAQGELRKLMDQYEPKQAVKKFMESQGRKPKIATFPKGSVPDTVLRHWLIKVADIPLEDVEIVPLGASRVQQALLADSVDAASILEPVLTIVLEKKPDAKVFAKGGEMLPNQPGAVLAVRERLIKDKPEVVKTLVALHRRATQLILEDPKRAAKHVHKTIGEGLIPISLIEKAITSPYLKFQPDPRKIVDATQVMHDFQEEIGTLRNRVAISELFDLSFYEALDSAR